MAFGVTPEGFIKKRLIDIKIDLENSLRASLGKTINLLPVSVLGQIVGIIAERESLLWELSEEIFNSQYPDTSGGVALDNVVAITGISRIPSRPTVQKDLHLFGTPGTAVPLGTQIKVANVLNAVFTTNSAVVLAAGVDEIQTISFSGVPVAGSWRLKYLDELTILLPFNATTIQIQDALNNMLNLDGVLVVGSFGAGFSITFAGDSGKINHSLLEFLDNTLAVIISIVQTVQGVPQATVDATCLNTGPIPSFAFSLTEIVTPVSGLTRVINIINGVLGRNIETDTELRIRRNESLQVAGSATVDAIRSDLLNVAGVNEALVFENTTFVIDANGFPGKSFAAFVDGGEDEDIAKAIWGSKPAGIEMFGSITEPVLDSQGFSHNVKFSRPTTKDIWVELDIATGPNFNSSIIEIQDAIVAHGNALGIGTDIIVTPDLICVLDQFKGVTDVVVRVGFASLPTLDNNLVIAPQEISKWANARTLVSLI